MKELERLNDPLPGPEHARLHQRAFHGPGDILWVCATRDLAITRYLRLGEPKRVVMAVPGQAFIGRGFNEIILEDVMLNAPAGSEKERLILEWRHLLRCRLYPFGKMRTLLG